MITFPAFFKHIIQCVRVFVCTNQTEEKFWLDLTPKATDVLIVSDLWLIFLSNPTPSRLFHFAAFYYSVYSWCHIYVYFYGVVYVNMSFLDTDSISLNQLRVSQNQGLHLPFQLCSAYNEHIIWWGWLILGQYMPFLVTMF